MSGAVKAAELFEEVQGGYNPATGNYAQGETSRGTCRVVVETQKPMKDLFPDLVAGPQDMLVFLEGLTSIPKEGWILRMDGTDYHVQRAQDILLNGSMAYAVVK